MSGIRASSHGGSFVPLVGPEAEIIRIIQDNYQEGAFADVVLDEENAAREIATLFRELGGTDA